MSTLVVIKEVWKMAFRRVIISAFLRDTPNLGTGPKLNDIELDAKGEN
jgi:hypothetical protein